MLGRGTDSIRTDNAQITAIDIAEISSLSFYGNTYLGETRNNQKWDGVSPLRPALWNVQTLQLLFLSLSAPASYDEYSNRLQLANSRLFVQPQANIRIRVDPAFKCLNSLQ